MKAFIWVLLLVPSIATAQNQWGQAANSFARGFEQQLGLPVQPSYHDQQYRHLLERQQLLQNQQIQQQINQQYRQQIEGSPILSEPVARPIENRRLRTNCITIGTITTCN
jgi:hypothetical protein